MASLNDFIYIASAHQVKQIDNRGSNFYVALYWAEELAAKDPSWAPLAQVSAFFFFQLRKSGDGEGLLKKQFI